MTFFKKSLAGPGYIILNAIRVINIICLVAVIAASSVMLIKTFIVSKFFFFDAVSHVITAAFSVFLIVTELPLFRGYFARNWPLYSLTSGFVALGTSMIILGMLILGNLNKEATSQKSLGTPFWRIVISSGIVSTIFGFVNIVSSYIFRTRSLGVTARMVRAYGAVAPQKVDDVVSRSSSRRRRSFYLNRGDVLPSYNTTPRRTGGLNISAPMHADEEQFAKFNGAEELKRPDLAMHPALHDGEML